MVFAIASWQVAPGKVAEAWKWANEAVDYANKTHGGKTHVTRNVFAGPGQGGRITFIGTHESIVAWEEYRQKRGADPKWKEYQGGVQTLLIPSTFQSTIYEERSS